MSTQSSVDIVHAFWDEVWNAHDPAAADRFVTEDFVIVTGGETISGRENFTKWIERFLVQVTDLHLEVTESFQNADGSRVMSRWLLTGKNNGLFGTEPDQQDIAMTGTAVWAVRGDGKLLTNWVERAAWEQFQRLKLEASA
jgi:ketosteroid isomerase-like protein